MPLLSKVHYSPPANPFRFPGFIKNRFRPPGISQEQYHLDELVDQYIRPITRRVTKQRRQALSLSSARTTKRFPSPRCASAIQIVRPLESIAEDPAPTPTGFAQIVRDCFPIRQPICQAALNDEFGNSRDASVHADGAKSRFPKRALRLRNSLRMATQIYGPHSAETEQRGETGSLTSPSQLSQIYRPHSVQTERGETASLISLSRRSNFISWRDQMLAVFFDEAGNMIGTHEHAGEFKEW